MLYASDISFKTSNIVAAFPGAISNGSNINVENDFFTSALESNIPVLQKSAVTITPVESTFDADRWDAEKNSRFKVLARKEALEDLSVEEFSELESLTRLRRLKLYPRTADEILWQRGQQKVTQGLVQALKAYVKYYEPKSGT